MIVILGNLYYYPLKRYVFITSYLYFRKLRVAGRENIPTKGPVIFAINHQNALLDPMLLSVISWRNSHFFPSGRTLISFGKPIKVADFKETYLQDQNIAIEGITRKVSAGIKSNALHFESKEDYDQGLKSYLEKRIYKKDLQKQLETDQALVDSLEKGESFTEKSDKKNPLQQIPANTWLALWHIVSFILKSIVDYMVKKSAKDPHFIGTMRYTFTIFLYPVIY